MKNYYSTVNNIVLTFTDIYEDRNGFEFIDLHYERPNETGFDYLDMTIPGNTVTKSFGFSEDEVLKLKRYATRNESLLWDIAREKETINI